MTAIENTLGKRIQITNSPIYCQLNRKIDPQFDMNYESLLMSISNLAHTMGRYMDADVGKIDLYVSMFGLGKLDGGKVVFDYINSNIEGNKSQIQELDVMLFNLKNIFPDLEERFNENNFNEFLELFIGNPTVKEIKIIKLAYYLKMVAQNLKRIGSLDDRGTTDFIFNEMQRVINVYKKTGQVVVGADINNLITKFYNQTSSLNNDDVQKLDKIIKLYNNGVANKEETIDMLNKFEITKEKKNKVR